MAKPEIPNWIRRKGEKFSLVKVKKLTYWEAHGCSHRGRTTKRDGKRVVCGHKHKTRETASKCAKRMKAIRVGNCQCYEAHFMNVFYAHHKRPALQAK